ncbi:MAG TPA: hypothetical protein VMN37_05120 [Gemmatimonadales bacterium]|nr:hypothetical protein [Gemmatimonadales bacterium]
MTGAALLLGGIALIADAGRRRLGALGLVALGLATAAAGLAPGVPAPPGFLAINAGLGLLGGLLCLTPLAAAGRRARGLEVAGPVLGVVGWLLAARELFPLVVRAGPPATVAAAATIAAAGWAASRLGRRTGVGEAIRRRDPGVPRAEAPFALAAVALGTAAAGLGGHIALVVTGAMIAAWAGWLAIPRGTRPRPVAPLLVVLLLGPALWLLATIAGPEGLRLSAIPLLPLSPAAERLIAPLLLAGAWALCGLWPLRQPAGGALTAPAGALLLIRLAVPAVPSGLEHWRAAAFPIVLLGLWYAAVTRRHTALLVGSALLGIASLQHEGGVAAGWLLASAAALEAMRAASRVRPGLPHAVPRALIAVAAGWGAIGVLRAGLETEVVYTVAAAGAAALALGGRPALTPPPAGSIFGPETR